MRLPPSFYLACRESLAARVLHAVRSRDCVITLLRKMELRRARRLSKQPTFRDGRVIVSRGGGKRNTICRGLPGMPQSARALSAGFFLFSESCQMVRQLSAKLNVLKPEPIRVWIGGRSIFLCYLGGRRLPAQLLSESILPTRFPPFYDL